MGVLFESCCSVLSFMWQNTRCKRSRAVKGNYYYYAIQLPLWARDLCTEVRSCNKTSFPEDTPDQKLFLKHDINFSDRQSRNHNLSCCITQPRITLQAGRMRWVLLTHEYKCDKTNWGQTQQGQRKLGGAKPPESARTWTRFYEIIHIHLKTWTPGVHLHLCNLFNWLLTIEEGMWGLDH